MHKHHWCPHLRSICDAADAGSPPFQSKWEEEEGAENIKYHFIWFEVIKQSSENEVIYDCQLAMADEFLALFYGMLENAPRPKRTREWMVILSENGSYYKRAIITSN